MDVSRKRDKIERVVISERVCYCPPSLPRQGLGDVCSVCLIDVLCLID